MYLIWSLCLFILQCYLFKEFLCEYLEDDVYANPSNLDASMHEQPFLNYHPQKIHDVLQRKKQLSYVFPRQGDYARPILNREALYSLFPLKTSLTSDPSGQDYVIKLPPAHEHDKQSYVYSDAHEAYYTEELGGEPLGNSSPFYVKPSFDLAQAALDNLHYHHIEQDKSSSALWDNWGYQHYHDYGADQFTSYLKTTNFVAAQPTNPWLQVLDNYDWDDDPSYDLVPSPMPSQDLPAIPECRIEAFDMSKKMLIGKGGQAMAFLVGLKSNSTSRFIYKAYSRPIEFQRELRTALFTHPNIIKIGCIVSNKLAVMMPYADGGDLWKGFPRSKYELSEDLIVLFAAQLIVATEKMHSAGFLHHDIKPHNLVRFLRSNRIALIDFGLSVPISSAGYRRGTRITMSPEVATIMGYDKAPLHEGLDWWSVGITIYMLHRAIHLDPSSKDGWGSRKENQRENGQQTPTSTFSESSGILNDKRRRGNGIKEVGAMKLPVSNYVPCRITLPMEKRKGQKFAGVLTWAPIPDTLSPELRSLLRRLLHPDPNKRRFHTQAQMNRLKAHPYFQRINWNRLY